MTDIDEWAWEDFKDGFATLRKQGEQDGVAPVAVNEVLDPECNPNHLLLHDKRGSLKWNRRLPPDGTRAHVLYSLLKDGRWHSVQECYDYVKAHYPGNPVTVGRSTFGQRNLSRYIEVCITDDDRVRIGKRHSA